VRVQTKYSFDANHRVETDAEYLCRGAPKPEGSALEDHVQTTCLPPSAQQEAIDWSKKNGHAPLVARVRHLIDKKEPDHWRAP
jgi:hypothetical protein